MREDICLYVRWGYMFVSLCWSPYVRLRKDIRYNTTVTIINIMTRCDANAIRTYVVTTQDTCVFKQGNTYPRDDDLLRLTHEFLREDTRY